MVMSETIKYSVEERFLHVVIAALAKEAKIDIQDSSKAAKRIVYLAGKLNLSVGEAPLCNRLKNVCRNLGL